MVTTSVEIGDQTSVGGHQRRAPSGRGRDDPRSWDLGFLVFGALLVLVGIALSRSGRHLVHTGSIPRR